MTSSVAAVDVQHPWHWCLSKLCQQLVVKLNVLVSIILILLSFPNPQGGADIDIDAI